jgi:disulfide oxidoreductase YuzD
MVRAEVEQRYTGDVSIVYIDTTDPAKREMCQQMVGEIQDRGLVYPVTVVDGMPMYDGTISYPAILRAIEARFDPQQHEPQR